MQICVESNLVKALSLTEKKKMRAAVISELEKYRKLREYEQLTKKPLTEAQETFCRRVEKSIEGLPEIERIVISKRYTDLDSECTKDYQVYSMSMEPPISAKTYTRVRDNAMFRIAFALGLDIGVQISAD